MDLTNIIYEWQNSYCAGSIMPKNFREIASRLFSSIYEKNHNFHYNSNIFRVISPSENNFILKLDDLYYSFSKNIDGIKEVISKDKWLRTNFILIEAMAEKALDFNLLCDYIFSNYSNSRYIKENEVVSKLLKENIISIKFYKTIDDIDKKDFINISRDKINKPLDKILKL